jgi:hypothetical protein
VGFTEYDPTSRFESVAVALITLEKVFGPVMVTIGVLPVGAPEIVTVRLPVVGGAGGHEVSVSVRARSETRMLVFVCIDSSDLGLTLDYSGFTVCCESRALSSVTQS